MQFRKSPIALAAFGLFSALPLAASAAASAPYSGTAVAMPASLPAVNFDRGGEGVAYHDATSSNLGQQYRASEAVDIYASADAPSGPYEIANFQSGEWLHYTVNVPADGNYHLGIRASNNFGTGAFHIEVDGVNVTGTVSVPKTGSWTTYQWFGKKDVRLSAGTHVVRLVADQQWFNVSALTMQAGTPLASTPVGGLPYTGTAVSLPANVAAVNFDKGGEGVAYHDLSSTNLGGLFRTSEGVDIYASTDTASGPHQIANFQTGEWMKYTVKVAANGNYDLGIRASNNAGTGAFHIEVDGVNVTGTVSVPKTGSWTTYQWFGKRGVPLTAGTHVVRLVADQQWFNVTSLSMLASGTTSTGGTSSGGTSTGGTSTGGTSTGGTSTGGTSSGGTTTGGTSSGSTGGTTSSAPYTGTAISLPAALAAANFDKGGEGVAYHDLSSTNLGGLYRASEGVDIYASTDTASGPYQIANFQTGEWMKYTVKVAANGNFDLGIRAANNAGTGAFHIEVDGVNVTGTVSVPKTGSWTTYQWFGKRGVPLTAGTHVVRLVADQQWFNVSSLSMLASGTTSTGGTTSGGTTSGGTSSGGTNTGDTGSTGGTATKPANLLFWSGFEGNVALQQPTNCYQKGCYQTMAGTDSSTGYSWPYNMMNGSNNFQMIAHSGDPSTPDTIGRYMYNEFRNEVGPKGKASRVLYSEVRQSGCCGTDAQGTSDTQDAFHLYPGAEPGDIYFSKWMKFQPNLAENLKSGAPWRVVFEWKEGGGSAGSNGAFRAILHVTFQDGNAPAWQTQWDNNANGGLPLQIFYRSYNRTVPVPAGEWFKLEVFWHRAKDNTGRIWFAVNGQVIDDHRGPTIGVNNTPIGRIMINQVYSGAPYPIYQWSDDYQMWKGWPTAKQGDPWYDPPYAPH